MPKRARYHQEEEESVFVSMTDIMVGLLFIFLMIIMYFAIQTQRQQELISSISESQEQIQGLTELTTYQERVDSQKKLILDWIVTYLESSGITGVEVIQDQGVIRLPEGILFDTSQFSVEEGTNAFLTATILAEALASILPCSTLTVSGLPYVESSVCAASRYSNFYEAYIQGIYIEGHTDDDPVPETGLAADPQITSNLKLAARRSTNTFEILLSHRPELLQFHGPVSSPELLRFEPVLASSVYGEYRPVVSNDTETNKRVNRRIDIRVVMYQPITSDALERLQESLRGQVEVNNQ